MRYSRSLEGFHKSKVTSMLLQPAFATFSHLDRLGFPEFRFGGERRGFRTQG
ncbi:hypothetical protein KFK09_018166 [Dendrobium nobile]|uniref:Uncharacterized protein n=1 Tax=Dendrobium nobile TaxID=94219 RepID=A0A8T3AV61_DENNO|nr:hypothetical protein KFK09_018166 [Dendrobium nobile]